MDYDFPIILGMSSSQLTFTPSFFRGVAKNHQVVIVDELIARSDVEIDFSEDKMMGHC